MSVDTLINAKVIWDIVRWPIVLLLGLIGWNLKRQVTIIDELKETSVKKGDFNATISSLRDSHEQTRTEILSGIKNINVTMQVINQRIDRVVESKDK